MNKKYISVLIVMVSLVLGQGMASGEKLTLADAISKGLKNNFGIRISKQNLKIAENTNTWGMAGRYPTLTIGGQSLNSWNSDSPSTDGGEREEYRSNLLLPNVNLRWILFSGFSISITKSKFELLNKLSEGNSAVIVENTIQGIILAYYKVLLEAEKVKVLEELKKLSGDRLEYVNLKKELGAISTYEALQSKIAFLNDSAGLAGQQINFRNAKRNLSLVLGEEAVKEYDLVDPFNVELSNYDLSVLREQMFGNNKTLKNQYINLQILKKDISFNRSPLYPAVTLNAGLDGTRAGIKYSGVPEIVSDSYDYYVNMSIGWTLYNGGKVRTAIKNAKISENIGNIQLDEMKFTLDNALVRLFETYDLRKELYTLADEGLKSASLNLKISI